MNRTELEYYINRLGGYKTDDTAFGIEFLLNGIKGNIEKLKYGYYINYNGVTDYGTKRTVLDVLESFGDGTSL
jgi:hypothetical protein